MTGNKSSAVAQELIRYANTAADINGALNNEADKLWAALKTFAATCTEYKTGVGPDLAGELHAYVRRTAPTDAWVRQVGQDFAKADGGGRQHNAGAPTFAAMRLPPTLLRAAAFRDDPAKAEQAAPTSTSRQAGKEARTADGKALQKGSQNYAAYIQGVESAEDSARIWLGASLKPYVLQPDEGEVTNIRGGEYVFKAKTEDTGGAFTLMEITFERGGAPPPHIHHKEVEAFYLLDGEMTFFAGGQTLPAQAGSTALLPIGLFHSYTIDTETARTLLIASPSGLEKFFRELGLAGDRPLSARQAAGFGVEPVVPPGAGP